jgi:NAD-dependent dihydropyrimidine dehydrogenase PreA subunit
MHRHEGQLLHGGLSSKLRPPGVREQGFADSRTLYIDPDECVDCDACITACPVNAIFPEADVPPEWSRFIALNAGFFRRA